MRSPARLGSAGDWRRPSRRADSTDGSAELNGLRLVRLGPVKVRLDWVRKVSVALGSVQFGQHSLNEVRVALLRLG